MPDNNNQRPINGNARPTQQLGGDQPQGSHAQPPRNGNPAQPRPARNPNAPNTTYLANRPQQTQRGGTTTQFTPVTPPPKRRNVAGPIIFIVIIALIVLFVLLLMLPNCSGLPWMGNEEDEPPVVTSGFSDVEQSEWYYTAVNRAHELGYMNGVGGADSDEFAPLETLNRGQASGVLYNMADAKEASEEEKNSWPNPFPDVTSAEWYYDTARWAGDMHIINGIERDGILYFDAEGPVTRQQFAVMLYHYAEDANGAYTMSEEEINQVINERVDGYLVADWARPGIAWALVNGIIGTGGSDINPEGYVNRAEAAAMVVTLQPQARTTPLIPSTSAMPVNTDTTDNTADTTEGGELGPEGEALVNDMAETTDGTVPVVTVGGEELNGENGEPIA